jgi:hypothetical protein
VKLLQRLGEVGRRHHVRLGGDALLGNLEVQERDITIVDLLCRDVLSRSQCYATRYGRNLGMYVITISQCLSMTGLYNVCREKGLLLSFVYKFGLVACRCC